MHDERSTEQRDVNPKVTLATALKAMQHSADWALNWVFVVIFGILSDMLKKKKTGKKKKQRAYEVGKCSFIKYVGITALLTMASFRRLHRGSQTPGPGR